MHHEHTLFGDRYSNNISRNTQSKQSLTAGPDSGVRAYVTVPLEVEYNGEREKKNTKSIEMTNVIFGMQTLYKSNIIGFQHWLAKRRTM